MGIVSNIIFASIILSVMIIMIINYVYIDYNFSNKDQVKVFLYICIATMFTMQFYKSYVVDTSVEEKIGGGINNTQIDEVFTELEDSKIYVNNDNIDSNELIINDIPNIYNNTTEDNNYV